MKSVVERKNCMSMHSVANCKEFYSLAQTFQCENAPALQDDFRDVVSKESYVYRSQTHYFVDDESNMIVGYVSLSTYSMFTDSQDESFSDELRVGNIIPCVEIQRFCVNDNYKTWLNDNGYDIHDVGQFLFKNFVRKILVDLSCTIGFQYVVLFAIDNPKVITSYKRLKFISLEDNEYSSYSLCSIMNIPHDDYSMGCKFMYQPLEDLIYNAYAEREVY